MPVNFAIGGVAGEIVRSNSVKIVSGSRKIRSRHERLELQRNWIQASHRYHVGTSGCVGACRVVIRAARI